MDKLDPTKVKYFIIHCTDCIPNDSIDVDVVTAWHKARGFEDIGYHYLIKTNGVIELGRSYDYVGAHAYGYNKKSIGIAYVGGRNSYGAYADTRTFNQKISFAYLMMFLVKYFPFVENIVGHNDVSTKACPCFDAKFEYRDFLTKCKANYPIEFLKAEILTNYKVSLNS